MNRLGLAYLFLVGLPLLLILGTLEAGRSLVAPPAVAGSWLIALDGSVPSAGCARLVLDTQPLSAQISQSGTSLSIVLNDPRNTVFTAVLISGRFTGAAPAFNVAGCKGVSLAIEANVVGEASGRSLTGRFLFGGCPVCAAVPFRASRRISSGRKA
jgi:hypothetical protein